MRAEIGSSSPSRNLSLASRSGEINSASASSANTRRRGDKVDGALAPPGSLHQQQPLSTVHQGVNGLPLSVAEIGILVGKLAPEQGKRLGLIGYGRSESITCSSVLVHPLFYATSPWFVVDH